MEAAGSSWQGVGRPTWHLPVREQAFQHLTNPRLGTDGSRGHGCHPEPEAETAWRSCLGAELSCVQASGSSWTWVFPGAQPLLSTPGFQRGAHTLPLNTCRPLRPDPQHPLASAPRPFWRAPLGLCPFQDPPRVACCDSHGSLSGVVALPSWKPLLQQLPAPHGNQPARMRGPAHSTPTPSPRLCPGLPQPEPQSALGVRLVLPSRADSLSGADSRHEDTGASLRGPPPRPEQEPWGTRVRVRCCPAGQEGAVGCGASRELHSSWGRSDSAGWTRNSQRMRMSQGPGWGLGSTSVARRKRLS